MKKILYIGNKLKSSNTTVLKTLSNQLKKEGFSIIVKSSKENMILRLIDMLYSIVIFKRHVQYVLIDTYSTKNFYYALLCSQLCRIFKLNYIPILHGGNLPNRIKNSPKMSNMIFNNSYKNIAPSNYLKEAFEKQNYHVDFIPNNIEIKDYKFKERKEINPSLLYVRSFSSIYNPTLAIEVLKELKLDYPEAKLCMVGPDKDGSLQECKDLVNKYGLNTSVKFTGKLTKPEWHKLSKEYSIFINTTNFDNTPISVIEVMALGLPVVSTNVGGIPYLLDHNRDSLLVNPNNVNEMTTCVKELLSNHKKNKDLAINARKKVEQFDWEIVKQKWLSILK